MEEGHVLFTRYILEIRKISQLQAAEALDQSPPSIHCWMNNKHRPNAFVRKLIEEWTGGFVPADSWFTEEERGRIESVKQDPAAE